MTTRPDPHLIAAARLLENAAHKLPAAKRHLQREQLILDGMPATASGGDRDPTSSGQTIRVRIEDENGEPILNERGEPQYDWVPVTSVEAAVIRIDNIDAHREDLLATVRGACVIAHNLSTELDRILGTRVAATPRCSPEGREGAQIWAPDPPCSNVPSRGPLCDRCAKAEYRYRVREGLPARRDGLFSQDNPHRTTA